MGALQLKFRAPGGAAGSPATMKSAEIVYNMADGKFYVGYGDDGNGNATSVKVFAQHDYVPSAGGETYTAAPGGGLILAGTAFSVDFTEVASQDDLADGLAGKADSGHTHDASAIVSGTIDPARLPAAVFQAPVVSSGAISDLTGGQQATVVAGTTVVTTDGRFWMYSGSGSKTLEASYTELADKTPEWTVIANKPANVIALGGVAGATNKLAYFTGPGAMDVTDFTAAARTLLAQASQATMRSAGLGLGSIATQNANNVAITGGAMSGTDVDFGTF